MMWPCRDDQTHVQMNCTASSDVETDGGNIKGAVIVDKRVVETKQEPYCWTTKCPAYRERIHELDTFIPKDVPKGISVTIQYNATTPEDRVIFCTAVNFLIN